MPRSEESRAPSGRQAAAGIRGGVCALLFALAPAAAPGQTDSTPFPPTPLSLGQPPAFPIRFSTLAGYDFDLEHPVGRLLASASRPVLGSQILGIEGTFEAGAGTFGSDLRGVAGAYVGVPWAALGAEYQGDGEPPAFAISLRIPKRRGGWFRRGDLLRLDFHPERQELWLGLSLRPPFERYRPNRPWEPVVRLPASRGNPAGRGRHVALGAEIESHLESVRHSIRWMDRLLTPKFAPGDFEAGAKPYREHIRLPGHTFLEEDRAYHRELDLAFTHATRGDSSLGRSIAALAESVIFREVLVPFDRLLGREKSPRGAAGFCGRAAAAFETALLERVPAVADTGDDGAVVRACSAEILKRVLAEISAASVAAGERWSYPFLFWTNRGALAWLPLNYGLRPEQYDTQAEWDGVLAAVTGEPQTDPNGVEYLMMEQFHPALKQMIRDTRRYQVTIIHDLRGRTPARTADLYGWDLVVDGYIRAFREAIRELDNGERDRLPQFYLFLDANYYHENGSGGIVGYLEHLLDPRLPMMAPKEYREQVSAAHDSLLLEVSGSSTLRGADPRALRDAIKVHVSVTNQFDPAFSLDLTRRDHRKLAFADVTEEDPSAGVALVTGQGIGEHYNGSGWEDRSLRVRGPSLVRLKTAARDLCRQQGLKATEVPECLRPAAFPGDYEGRCQALPDSVYTGGATVLVNETGYEAKECTVLKAAIYNLAPPGSALLSFDSLWYSEFWAGLFLCAALRGVHSLPVAPAPANAPSAGLAPLASLRETLRMMAVAGRYFAEDFERSGGMLRVGLYSHSVQTTDFRKRVFAFQQGARRHAFLRDVLPWHPAVDDSLESFRSKFRDVSFFELMMRPRPFLHMKSQLFGTAEAFEILRVPEIAPALANHLAIRQRQVQGMETKGVTPEAFRPLLDAYHERLARRSPGADERAVFTFTMGSQNMNPRSMLLDGEVLVAISGDDSVIALIDSMFLLFVSEWPADLEEFDRLFPRKPMPFFLKPLRSVIKVHG
jgi:hypothetical protein